MTHATQHTSAEAYTNIQDDLGDRQRLVWDFLIKNGPHTNTEISEGLGLPINVITPRTNELVKKKFVFEHGTRKCHVTGRMAKVWGVVKNTLF